MCLVLKFLECRQSHKQLCSTVILWNFAFFGAEPLLNVLKTTTKGRSFGGRYHIYIYIHIHTISKHLLWGLKYVNRTYFGRFGAPGMPAFGLEHADALAAISRSKRLVMCDQHATMPFPHSPSTQCLRSLVPKTIALMVFGTSVLTYWVLEPSGLESIVCRPINRLLAVP